MAMMMVSQGSWNSEPSIGMAWRRPLLRQPPRRFCTKSMPVRRLPSAVRPTGVRRPLMRTPSRFASKISSGVTGMYSSAVRMWMVTSCAPRRAATRAQSSAVKPAPTTATRLPTVFSMPRCISMRKSRPYSTPSMLRSSRFSHSPSSGKGEAAMQPVASSTASNSCCSLLMGIWPSWLPISTPVRTCTPRRRALCSSMSSVLRGRRNSGMP